MLLFAASLFVVQLVERTSLVFALLFFVFLVTATLAFNAGGGFSRPSGAYVFLFALLTCVFGVFWKAVLGEPADSNLLVPTLDMACYAGSMLMMLVVILANKIITGRSQGIAPLELDYTLAAVGCLAVGFCITVLDSLGLSKPGSALGVVNQLSEFYQLAMLLGTIGAIKDSAGRRSVNFVNGITFAIVGVNGTLAFSKQGMFTPMFAWLIAAAFMRFKLRLVHWIVLIAFAGFALFVAPSLAGGRIMVSKGGGLSERIQIAYYLVTHLQEARQQQEESNALTLETRGHTGYYAKPQGLLDRLTMLEVDDTFFNYTNRGNFAGYGPIIADYKNFVPHFIEPNKPEVIGGNFYAHEIGGYLADDDDSTGISFSPVAEAYHIDGWVGIFLLLPAIWLMLFIGSDFLCGDMRRSPWGLLLVLIFAHSAPESLISALIWITGYGLLGILVAILFCTEFAPILGALFYGSQRRLVPGRATGRPSSQPAHSS